MAKFLSCDVIISLSVQQHGALIERQRGRLAVPVSDRALRLWRSVLILVLALLLVLDDLAGAVYRHIVMAREWLDATRLGLFIFFRGFSLCLAEVSAI